MILNFLLIHLLLLLRVLLQLEISLAHSAYYNDADAEKALQASRVRSGM